MPYHATVRDPVQTDATWTLADAPDQSGRVAIVTGANSGIGLETAAALGAAGARVVLACRDEGRATTARDELLERVPDATFEVLRLDLADQDQIADAAAEATERLPRLDLLVNNAGVMGVERQFTPQGHELVFGTNHLGHAALTARLLPTLLATSGSRVVTVASLSHRFGRIAWDDLTGSRRYNKTLAYAQSKLANLLFAFELQRRLAAGDCATASLAAHPGFAGGTNVAQHWRISGTPIETYGRRFTHSNADAALPSVRAALDPGAYGGQFYGPGGALGVAGPPVVVRPAARSLDERAQRRLWDLTEELIGIEVPVPAPSCDP